MSQPLSTDDVCILPGYLRSKKEMKQVFRAGVPAVILMMMGWTPALTQGLFESPLPGTHENLVSNSLILGGFIRSVAYLSNDPETDSKYFQSAYGQVGFLLNAKAGDWASAKADIRFRYGTEFGQTIAQMEFREAYVDLWSGPAGFRFGKMITPWGKGTVFNPTEKLTPLDPTVRSPEEDDMYMGVWALQGRVNLGPSMKLTATWKPVYQSSVLLIDPIPMPDYVKFIDPGFPDMDLKEGSYGLNYDLFTSPLDLSLYWFEGYHHWPGIGFDSFTMDSLTMEPLALNLREEAYRIRMAGLDLGVPVGSWMFRMEGAWQQCTEPHETSEYLPFPELAYTAEIERSGNHFNLLAGYDGKYIIDHVPPAAEPSLQAGQEQFYQLMQQGWVPNSENIDQVITERVGAFNRLYNYQLEEFYHSIFIVGKIFLWHEKIDITIPLICNLTTREWIVRPGVSFMPVDGLKISAGFSGLYGPENSLYDLVGPVLNAGYLSLKITF
jgi:hypothetical protein